MIERQEIYCHSCNNYVQFNIDLDLNGNHVLECPECNHEHCRVVKNGQITGERWDQRNGYTYSIVGAVTSSTSMNSPYLTNTSTTSSYFLYGSWIQSANS